jgi:hypothetical protein
MEPNSRVAVHAAQDCVVRVDHLDALCSVEIYGCVQYPEVDVRNQDLVLADRYRIDRLRYEFDDPRFEVAKGPPSVGESKTVSWAGIRAKQI